MHLIVCDARVVECSFSSTQLDVDRRKDRLENSLYPFYSSKIPPIFRLGKKDYQSEMKVHLYAS